MTNNKLDTIGYATLAICIASVMFLSLAQLAV